ncbi:uncharacterized protein OCT59_023984 [Rhizophagus irregularis]|uniref:Uncharacterized protein n=2 Tax=Rhizophagus irregularis TaxID=588596 RepID=U9U1B5_RHIID|nr:hypothetical protein GLOIN_2v1709047 [Rhizophagus irregularis DAOM 181602=DAOM 197198]EXX64205.1 hypothetical protein RirG_145020 [Rhizophagus irregularis DAOM 197198w]UZO03580.1 hypothetical protein OCT59_023984 [Rhizophagus irregularis]POG60879.1 hypothetical protein GLOIN_2v1709047 [Rhizophagus irregularis DAOM 181602=DAOM 197198]CAG8724382.1 14305_t:CDS:1 [Rhizophagus irregularis]GBC22100.1 hypothetical protein GLOIN_2v1709047 [Rhizophagus irregularis DAOM 181602=DAOM 197198]|eukprot:XP_025167745.1 hypothetical protein GLOIN_2v1709047 [Rhizophagus irregularis DAOM 181602=DAOM 197198]
MGFWRGVGEVLKFTGKVAVVGTVGGLIVSTGGLAAPLIGGGTYFIGKGIKEIAKEEGSEFWEGTGDLIEDIGLDGLTGGLFNFGTQTAGHLAAREIARNGRKMTNGAKILIRVGQTIKIGKRVYEVCDKNLEDVKYALYFYHGLHKEKGNSYDSDCPICREIV